MKENKQTLPLCWPGPNHFIRAPAPGRAERKAARTTIVLTWRQETQSTKLIPKAACWNRQDQTDGRPMNTSEHRKHSFRDRRSRKLSSALLARTLRGIRLRDKEWPTIPLHEQNKYIKEIWGVYMYMYTIHMCYITLGSYHRCLTVGEKHHKHNCCHCGTRYSDCGQGDAQGFIKGQEIQLARDACSSLSIGPKLRWTMYTLKGIWERETKEEVRKIRHK